jgi:hypothetical protein
MLGFFPGVLCFDTRTADGHPENDLGMVLQ